MHPWTSCTLLLQDQEISICTSGSIFELSPRQQEFRDVWLAQLSGAAVNSAGIQVLEHVHLLLRRPRPDNSKVLPDHMTLESKFERVEGESHMGN